MVRGYRMKQTMTLDFELPDFNEIIADAKKINKKRGQRYASSPYSIKKNQYTILVGVRAKELLKPVPEKHLPIRLEIRWFCKNKRKNPDNISGGGTKCIVDGLVSASIIPNDGWSEICEIRHKFIHDKDKPRIIVVLEGQNEQQ